VQDLLDDLVRCLVRMIVRTVLTTREPGFAELAVSISPEVERRSRDPEPSACPMDVADLLGVLQDSLLTPDFPLIFGHLDPLCHHHDRVSGWICNFTDRG